jgi:mannose-6-phosphate isomerase-like protein (cupin superfamily)
MLLFTKLIVLMCVISISLIKHSGKKEHSINKLTNCNYCSNKNQNKIMKGYQSNIETITQENKNFRAVLYTGKHLQLVIMSLKPGEDIGEETHAHVDQFFRIEKGTGVSSINGVQHPIKSGDVIIVPAGAKHNVLNLSATDDLKLYTIYAPPNHEDKIKRSTKKVAIAIPEKFDGMTTE